jgi:hypothetical protein
MNENAYRARSERGEVQIGTFSSETAVLRAGYANAVAEIRRAPAARG